MLVGILETGKVNDTLVPRHGGYPPMFAGLLGPAGPELSYRSYDVEGGAIPASPAECDAWLITGSRHGVYDDLPWIEPLEEFLRAARAAGRPIVGICFGHQILAEALGGKAVKSDKGWGVGVHDYAVTRRPAWMTGAPATIAIHAFHQDQVIAIPDDATVLARSPFCEYAMLAYGDPEAPDAISIQPHPEFGEDYTRDLIDLRAGIAIPPEQAAPARETLGRPVHQQDFARWCVSFLRSAIARRKAA
jgi:GMP synthase-like glutamine amidotransferase